MWDPMLYQAVVLFEVPRSSISLGGVSYSSEDIKSVTKYLLVCKNRRCKVVQSEKQAMIQVLLDHSVT